MYKLIITMLLTIILSSQTFASAYVSESISIKSIEGWSVTKNERTGSSSEVKLKSKKGFKSVSIKVSSKNLKIDNKFVKAISSSFVKKGFTFESGSEATIGGAKAKVLYMKKPTNEEGPNVYLAIYLFKHGKRFYNMTTTNIAGNIKEDAPLNKLLAGITLN